MSSNSSCPASQSDTKPVYISHEIPPRTPTMFPLPTPIEIAPRTPTMFPLPTPIETPPPAPPIPPPTVQSADSDTQTSPEEELFKKVLQKEWDEVVKIYRDKKDIVWTAKITRAKETALHIAISDSETEVVEKLLKTIDDPIKIREMKNDMEENPLHLAASLGQAETCKILVEKDPELIGARNKEGETPLFQAALHGKKAAFYALHPKCPINGKDIKHDVVHCKRNDGNSILHVAIRGEYFGLANQIITWYPDLINFRNEPGLTALHVLAQNPSAFRSGCHLGPLDDFIYRCLIVDLPKVMEMPSQFKDEQVSDIDFQVPGNYETCLDLLKLWKDIFTAIARHRRKWEDIKRDICKLFNKGVEKHELPVTCTRDPKQDNNDDDPSEECHRSHIGDKTNETRAEKRLDSKKEDKTDKSKKEGGSDNSTKGPMYPNNYITFLYFLVLAMEFSLFVLGLGYYRVRKLKAKKQKHKLTFCIMKKLVQANKYWAYMDSGLMPLTVDSSLVSPATPPETTDPPTTPKDSDHPTKDNRGKIVIDTMLAISKTEVLLEAEETRPDIYRLKMLEVNFSGKVGQTCNLGDHHNSSPILIAVKMGVKEMVEEILNKFPVAIRDEDADKKNVVLLAVENRHPKIYKILLAKYCKSNESVFQKVDKGGNSAIHLAATIGKNQLWRIPGAALQMQWELKWYKYIKTSMPPHFFAHRNNEGKTSREVFAETHRVMVKDGGTWLANTSQSCSVVAALIATVAYASATTVPGGSKEGTGIPILRGHPAFDIFTIASLVALCLSVTSLTMFLSILTSRYQASDFLQNLPTKLILGLTTLFISIAAMLVSFCAGNFFDLGDRLRHTAYPIYAITCLPVTIYAVAQFPLYFDLIKSTVITVPERSYEVTTL